MIGGGSWLAMAQVGVVCVAAVLVVWKASDEVVNSGSDFKLRSTSGNSRGQVHKPIRC